MSNPSSPVLQLDSEITSSQTLVPLFDEETVMPEGGDRGSTFRKDDPTEQAYDGISSWLRLFRGALVDVSSGSETSSLSDHDELNATTQLRTSSNMFGITHTEFTRIDITQPVLYVGVYDTVDAQAEVDDFHWAFIVGPSHEEAASKGTLYNMEPRQKETYFFKQSIKVWRWLYNQPTVPLRGQNRLLFRLLIAEVSDMDILQAVVLRWATAIDMYDHADWMSVKWIQNVLKDLHNEEGCLGRRMENFESVEGECRFFATVEQDKRMRLSLLDTRVSTRALFKRERATTFFSTATVDIVIQNPVLYVGVYVNDLPSPKEGEYHWAFLIGSANETAESECVRCEMKAGLDLNGKSTQNYNQTIVSYGNEPDLLVRLLIAQVVDLKPLGAIIRDQGVTPQTIPTSAVAKGFERSLAWIEERLEKLERKPEVFAQKFSPFTDFHEFGIVAAEDAIRIRKANSTFTFSYCLVDRWKKPKDDSNFQIGTGILGAAAFDLQWPAADNEREVQDTQGQEAVAEFEKGGEVTMLAELTELRRVLAVARWAEVGDIKEEEKDGDNEGEDEDEDEDESVDGDESGSESESEDDAESEDESGADEEKGGDDSDRNNENEETDNEENGAAEENIAAEKANPKPDNAKTTAVAIAVPNKPEQAAGKRDIAKGTEEDEDDTESEEDDSSDEDNDEEENEEGDGNEDEENEEHAGLQMTASSISTLKLSR